MAAASEVVDANAAARVFETVELLEKILVDLFGDGGYKAYNVQLRKVSLNSIYRLQRVNSTFRSTIARSKTLRVLMFKELQSDGEDVSGSEDQRDKWERQRIMMRFDNPLLWSLSDVVSLRVFARLDLDPSENVLSLSVSGNAGDSIEERFDSASSWRDMLLSYKPRYKNVNIWVNMDKSGFGGARVVELEEGTTLGQLVDEMLKAARLGRKTQEAHMRARERYQEEKLNKLPSLSLEDA